MKIIVNYPLVVLSLFISFRTIAQEVPDPDFSQKPYYYKDGGLAEFEKTDATLEKKMKGMGYGGVEYYYSVAGLKSSSRFSSTSTPKIIIKTDDNSDPTETFLVCIGENKKDSRRFKSFKMTAFGGTKGATDNKIKLNVKKLRDKVFEITIDQPLSPGEYAIVPYSSNATAAAMSTGIKVNCFGID